jgi:hypothetical protein
MMKRKSIKKDLMNTSVSTNRKTVDLSLPLHSRNISRQVQAIVATLKTEKVKCQ